MSSEVIKTSCFYNQYESDSPFRSGFSQALMKFHPKKKIVLTGYFFNDNLIKPIRASVHAVGYSMFDFSQHSKEVVKDYIGSHTPATTSDIMVPRDR